MKLYLTTFLFVILFNYSHSQSPPVAVNDTLSVMYNSEHNQLNVRLNDYDPDSTITRIDTVIYNGNAIVGYSLAWVWYTPEINFSGLDSLQYVIRSGNPYEYDTAWAFVNVRQSHYEYLDINNIKAYLGANASIFLDRMNGEAGFECPQGSDNHTIFAFKPWLTGYVDTTLKANVLTYVSPYIYGENQFSGPISDSIWYTPFNEKWDRVWKVSRSNIYYHLLHWNDNNYNPTDGIKNWPAHGDTLKGEAYYLAPFYDNNGDGNYNPFDGDFPEIYGDQAIFLMYNQIRPRVLINQGLFDYMGQIPDRNISKTEVHCMFYAYANGEDPALNNTIFSKIKFINRSNETYDNAYIGLMGDLDIGNPQDDYIGSNVMGNSFYAYNGDAIDESSSAGPGYDTLLVAQSVTLLKGVKMDDDGIDNEFGIEYDQSINGQNFGDGIIDNEYWGMNGFMYYNSGAGPYGDPWYPQDFYFYSQSLWRDGSLLSHGGDGYNPTDPTAITTKYAFPYTSDSLMFGTSGEEVEEWSEISEANSPGDRRGVGSTGPFTLLPFEEVEIDVAFIFVRDSAGSGILGPLNLLTARIETIQDHYQNGHLTVDIEKHNEINTSLFSVYPNPFTDRLTLENNSQELMTIIIYSIKGEELLKFQLAIGQSSINLDGEINDRIILIKSITSNSVETKKIIRVN